MTATNNCDANFLVHKTGTHRTNYQISNTLMLGFWWRVLVTSGAAALSVASMTLGDIDVTFVAGMALADIDVTFNFVWQACHLWHLLALGWVWRRGLCVADIDGHFAKQAWHSVASTFTLPGRFLILTLTLCGGRSDNSYGNGSGGALGRIWRCGTLSGS